MKFVLQFEKGALRDLKKLDKPTAIRIVQKIQDAIIEELWQVKDSLSQAAGHDLRAFCDSLNQGVRDRGESLINRSHYSEANDADLSACKVAEESDGSYGENQ